MDSTVSGDAFSICRAFHLADLESIPIADVRHHTNVLPTEYWRAASEVGMLVQAEFPMFGGRVACDASYACDKNAVYFQDWAFMIKTLRNFPAVFDYTMTNEGPLLNHQFAMELYALAKALDPMRPVSTSDGIGDDATVGSWLG